MKGKRSHSTSATTRKLSVAEKQFCHAYIENGGKGGPAWRTVHPDCAPAVSRVNACMALKRPCVKKYVTELLEEAHGEREAGAKRTLLELCAVAFADPTGVLDEDGQLVENLKSLPADVRASVASIDLNDDGKPVRVRFVPKVEALRLLAKYHGLSDERVRHEGGIEIRLISQIPRAPGDPPALIAQATGAVVSTKESAGGDADTDD